MPKLSTLLTFYYFCNIFQVDIFSIFYEQQDSLEGLAIMHEVTSHINSGAWTWAQVWVSLHSYSFCCTLLRPSFMNLYAKGRRRNSCVQRGYSLNLFHMISLLYYSWIWEEEKNQSDQNSLRSVT